MKTTAKAIKAMVQAWDDYREAYGMECEGDVCRDGVLGDSYRAIGRAIITLMQVTRARDLDRAHIDGYIRAIVEQERK